MKISQPVQCLTTLMVGKKNYFFFLFEISSFATCAHHISSCRCVPLKRVHLHLPPVSAASCRSCALSACSPGGVLLSAYCSLAMSLLSWGALKWNQPSQWALTRAGQRGKVIFPTVPTLLWLKQHHLWVTTFAARVHLWLVLNWLCIGLPRSSAKLLPWPCVVSSLGQDLVFALIES